MVGLPSVSRGDDGLLGVVSSLHSLLLSSSDLETFLGQVAGLAARTVVPAAACGITTRYDHHPLTVAASDPRAALIDEQQYGAGNGPCLEAMRTGVLVQVPDQASDERWPAYRAEALDLGVKCVLSLPLRVDITYGALNLYGLDRPHTFGVEQVRRAELFAAQAATALALALRHLGQTELTNQLEQAIAARSVIDQALGLLMGQQHCDADAAFDLLRRHSQNGNRKIRDVAAELIERMSGHPAAPAREFERLDRPDPDAD